MKEEMKAVMNAMEAAGGAGVSSSHASSPLINGISGDEDAREGNKKAPPEGTEGRAKVSSTRRNTSPADRGPFPPEEQRQGEEEKLEHMRSVADDLVAKLVEEDDPRPQSGVPNQGVVVAPPGGPLAAITEPPGSHATRTPGDDKWYYTDPQVRPQSLTVVLPGWTEIFHSTD